MIPEFQFKKKPITKRFDIKTVKEFLYEKRGRIAGGAVVGVLAIGLTVVGLTGQNSQNDTNVTAMLQERTAGVTTQIDTSEKTLQKQIDKADVSMSKLEAVMTGATMDNVMNFNSDAVSDEAVSEEVAADEVAANAAEVTPEAVEEVAEPQHPQLVGFSNPGIAANVEQFVNIRKSASETASICGKMNKNTACEILGEENGWYHVVTNGVEGYVKSEFLVTGDDAWYLADRLKYMYVRVLTETLYVREQPSTDSNVIAMASIDQKLIANEIQDEWVQVQIDGKIGYMNKAYIAVEYTLPKGEPVAEKKETKNSKSSKSSSSTKSSSSSSKKPAKDCSSVVEYATQFVGNPYVYGGTSLTKGTDCSGFTMSVYAKFGVYLPHSSSAQASCGVKVSASELAPGDLIFYGSGKSINHVGLYIGGGRIVHASTEKTGIKISNAFYRTPVTIRRVR